MIRTRNESDNLSICLEKLSRQTIKPEIIIVDSHSTDNTVEVAEKHGCKVIQCDDFTYGKALNHGIEATSSQYVGIMSGHCFPVTNMFLEEMHNRLTCHSVAGVYARQIPHPRTNPLEYRNFIYTYRLESSVQGTCPFFNNAASMIKRDIWEKVKFNENVQAQEDIIWAKNVQDIGYLIAYEPKAVVEHLHDEDISDTIKRYIKEYNVIKTFDFYGGKK